MIKLRRKAFAKVNLFLRVTGKDNSGYHTIESFFAPLGIYDIIEVSKSTTLECISSGEYKILGENIVLKLFNELKKYRPTLHGAKFYIEKRIPIGAGLGGGTSDAITALKLLDELYELHLSSEEMYSIATSIGSDAAFFLQNSGAFVCGRGECVAPLKLEVQLPIVLVNPGVLLSTAQVYALISAAFSTSLQPVSTKGVLEEIYAGTNDLTHAALKLHSGIADLLSTISEQPGCIFSRMSGSGSTCFGIFENEAKAKKALKALRRLNPSFWYFYELLCL